MKPFSFAKWFVKIQFFEEEPVVITLPISDEMDRKLLRYGEAVGEGDKQPDKRTEIYRQALEQLIGAETVEKLLARAGDSDSYALLDIGTYVLNCYREQKTKNLIAGAR